MIYFVNLYSRQLYNVNSALNCLYTRFIGAHIIFYNQYDLFSIAGEIPFYAAACLSLVCECIRMLTDNNSQMSALAARTGFVYTVLHGLNLLANNMGYSKVSDNFTSNMG